MADQCACECRYGNDMKLEKKQSDSSAQTNKQKGNQLKKVKRQTTTNKNIEAKWLIIGTTEFKSNEYKMICE